MSLHNREDITFSLGKIQEDTGTEDTGDTGRYGGRYGDRGDTGHETPDYEGVEFRCFVA
jgi:hypothetical protein